ncbi:MAG: hypothetical protein CXZ00_14255 [Acidobacteria bacterium]|nr:MAG: hypothetical protein CXZ00_14255 [Acidobacteriota bacterium]
MSYFRQLVGLTVQNFLAAASGLAIGVAFIRGFARQQTNKVGNFWVATRRSPMTRKRSCNREKCGSICALIDAYRKGLGRVALFKIFVWNRCLISIT